MSSTKIDYRKYRNHEGIVGAAARVGLKRAQGRNLFIALSLMSLFFGITFFVLFVFDCLFSTTHLLFGDSSSDIEFDKLVINLVKNWTIPFISLVLLIALGLFGFAWLRIRKFSRRFLIEAMSEVKDRMLESYNETIPTVLVSTHDDVAASPSSTNTYYEFDWREYFIAIFNNARREIPYYWAEKFESSRAVSRINSGLLDSEKNPVVRKFLPNYFNEIWIFLCSYLLVVIGPFVRDLFKPITSFSSLLLLMILLYLSSMTNRFQRQRTIKIDNPELSLSSVIETGYPCLDSFILVALFTLVFCLTLPWFSIYLLIFTCAFIAFRPLNAAYILGISMIEEYICLSVLEKAISDKSEGSINTAPNSPPSPTQA